MTTTSRQSDHRTPVQRAFSGFAFWLLVLVWMTWVTLGWQQAPEGFPVGVISSAYPESPQTYPEVRGSFTAEFVPPGSGPVRGDHLLRFGDADLRGLGPIPVAVRTWRARTIRPDGFYMPLTYLRGDREYQTTVHYPRRPLLRAFVLVAILEGILAIVVRLRSRNRLGGNAFSFATILHAILCCDFLGHSEFAFYAFVGGLSISMFLIGPQVLRCVMLVPEETAPKSRWPYWAAWATALPAVFFWDAIYGPNVMRPDVALSVATLMWALLMVCGFGLLGRNYFRAGPIGRRQLRWSLAGHVVAVPAVATALVLMAMMPDRVELTSSLHLLTVLVPITNAIAIVRFNLFDIDRIISAAAAYATTLVVLLAVGFVGARQVGDAVATSLGIEVVTPEMLSLVVLAALALPAQRFVHPLIERLFFKERFALQQGIAQLLKELGECASTPELLQLVGERLDAILLPQACVIYARTDEGCAAGFVRGDVHTPIFEASDPLLAVLAHRPGPLARERWTDRRGDVPLSLFDRAALDTLGAAVVVPARRNELRAFVCLGAKRSGDVYTATELALLAAVGDKLASEMDQLEAVDQKKPARAGDTARAAVDDVEVSPPNGQDAATTHEAVFFKEGDYWTVAYSGSVVRLKDSKGMQYLAWLLRHPAQEFVPLELVDGNGSGGDADAPRGSPEGLVSLDAQAKVEYRQALRELREELEESSRFNDLGRVAQLQSEIDHLTRELSAAVGLGGVDRQSGGAAERARVTVTKRIKDALKKIDDAHPSLGYHLRSSVRTGSLCGYNPPLDQPVAWKF